MAERPAGTAGRGAALDVVQLGYGVPGGIVTDGFYRDEAERQAVMRRTWGRKKHLGIDVSLSNASGGGASDARRGLPVYAVVRRTIPIAELNAVRVASGDTPSTGLGIAGAGDAVLANAVVLAQPWGSQGSDAYGGVVGLACRYTVTADDGTASTITLYLEFLHLITEAYLPRDGQHQPISAADWAATGKGTGFGPRIQNGAQLTADDLTIGDPILVGYLGATEFPHVHLQAAFATGSARYVRSPRFDAAVMLRTSAAVGHA